MKARFCIATRSFLAVGAWVALSVYGTAQEALVVEDAEPPAPAKQVDLNSPLAPIAPQEFVLQLNDVQFQGANLQLGGVPVPDEPAAQEEPSVEPADAVQQFWNERRQALLNYLLLRLDEMDRVCDLSDAQAAKLKIAAKGAADHSLAKWKEQFGPGPQVDQAPQAGFNPPRDIRQQQLAIGLGANEAQIQALQAQGGNAEQMRRLVEQRKWLLRRRPGRQPFPEFGSIPAVMEEPIWTAAVERMLSDEQKGLIREANERREKSHRDARIDLVVAHLDELLLLSDGQRESLRPMVEAALERQWASHKQLAETMRAQFGANATAPDFGTVSESNLIDVIFADLSQQDLSAVLSEPQWNSWRERHASGTIVQNGLQRNANGVRAINGGFFAPGGNVGLQRGVEVAPRAVDFDVINVNGNVIQVAR